MKAKFKKEETINAILYLLDKFGGKCDIHKISKLLYFSDREHLMKYGRLITGDYYIAMSFGPVPSRIYDIFKFLRGDSYFSFVTDDISAQLRMVNKEVVSALHKPDMDYLSESDVECLDNSINRYGALGFKELTDISHDVAWNNAKGDHTISYKDMLREVDCEEGYVSYVSDCIAAEARPF